VKKTIISLTVNGDQFDIAVTPRQTLVEVLRNELGLTGTKRGCDSGACGVCTVILDGRAILSCLTLAVNVEGRSITTIEGISHADDLHPIQRSFIENGAIQCGFCTPGIIMTAKSLLDKNPSPDEDEINEALAGTFCRCTGHIKIKEAITKVSTPKAEAKSNGS
jgi:carbon-monoxide dehydrogenase small subunit